MRFHVLGLGPVGQLLAFHLRRSLSQKHVVSLMFKTPSIAKRMQGFPLHIEHDGVVNSVSGFETESTGSFEGLESNSNLSEAGKLAHGVISITQKGVNGPNETKNPEEAHIDSLFVTCKAHSTVDAIKKIKHRLSSASTISLLQNGNLASYERLLENVFYTADERPNFILVSNTHGIWLKRAPFHTVHAGIGQLRFGIVPDGRRDFERSLHSDDTDYGKRRLRLQDIASSSNDPDVSRYRSLRNTIAVLQKLPGLQTKWESFSDMQVLLRQKLVVNCVINPITAILGCRNGELFEHDESRRLAYRICREASRVFRKEAIENRDPEVSPDDVYVPSELSLSRLLDEVERVARVTRGNTSSMLADIKKGSRMTEVEYLNGHLMALGRRYDVSVPVNASLVDLVKMRTEIPLDTML